VVYTTCSAQVVERHLASLTDGLVCGAGKGAVDELVLLQSLTKIDYVPRNGSADGREACGRVGRSCRGRVACVSYHRQLHLGEDTSLARGNRDCDG
jgi:hypothetical protein